MTSDGAKYACPDERASQLREPHPSSLTLSRLLVMPPSIRCTFASARLLPSQPLTGSRGSWARNTINSLRESPRVTASKNIYFPNAPVGNVPPYRKPLPYPPIPRSLLDHLAQLSSEKVPILPPSSLSLSLENSFIRGPKVFT